MEVMRQILSNKIDHKTASLLLYALQTASGKLRRTRIDHDEHDVILDAREAAITWLDYRARQDEEFEEEKYEEQQPQPESAKQ